MSLFHEFHSAISSLPVARQWAFACGCCEHTLPFFEYFCFSPAPRELLDAEWRVVFASTANQPCISDLAREAFLVIPNIGDEDDLPSQIAMKAAVPVLEVMDLLEGKSEAAIRIACSPLEVLGLIHLQIDDPVHPDFDLFEVVDNPSIVPTEIYEEWRMLNEMISQLRWSSTVSSAWRQTQKHRGVALLEKYRARLRAFP